MKVIVSNEIKVIDPPFELQLWCDENLVVDNPEYINKQKRGQWLGKTPKKLYLTKYNLGELTMPFGCLSYLWQTYRGQAEFIPKFAPTRAVKYGSSIKLYDYQERAVQAALKARNGIIVAPCGAGKTQIGLELAARLGVRVLWLTHKQDLLSQSMERAKANFELPEISYGLITAGKVRLGQITFATVQTMCNIDLTSLRDYFDCVIVDEVHHCVGTPTAMTQFYSVVSKLSARYKFGLTASEKRSDGLEKTMFTIIGDKIYEISKQEVADKTVPIRVELYNTWFTPDENLITAGDGTLVYSSLLSTLCESQERTETIAEVIRNKSGTTLVLSDRRKHLEALCKAINEPKSVILTPLNGSNKSRQERKESLERFNNGEIRIVFATYSIAKEGLDCPALSNVCLASPCKDPITVQQSCGRVGRKADGKEYGTVIDVCDDFGLLYSYAKKRKSIYRKLGYKIVDS